MSSHAADITIRQLTEDDWKTFSAIRLEALQACPSVFMSNYAKESAYTETDWRQWLSRTDGAIFVLCDDATVIGVTGIIADKNDPTVGRLIASYIRPAYRGRGLSSLLYDVRLTWAKNYAPMQKISVSHRDGNEASRRANQRHGFQYTHRESTTWPDGGVADDITYEYNLDQARREQPTCPEKPSLSPSKPQELS